MAGTFTPNYNFVLQGSGDNSGTWGLAGSGPSEPGLNSGIFSPLDSILGASLTVATSSGNNSLSLTSWVSAGIFVLTGALTGNANFILPLSPNSVGSATAVGGKFVVINNTTGGFNVTVKTASTTGTPTGVTVPQGFAASLYSDTINVGYANNGLPSFAVAFNGNPNGFLAGTSGSVNTNAELAFDYTNFILYVCTFTGPATGGPGVQAVWTNIVSLGLPQPALQGYLTPVSGQAIITSDFIPSGPTTIYYTPYVGTWSAIHNGTKIIPYQFTQMSLLLSSSQAASAIYDVFLAYNGGTPIIGTGPSWAASGGSVTPGSCARGTGAGSTAISRDAVSGLWVNTNSMTLTPTGSPITVGIGQGIYLGSLFIDTVAGQISCLRSLGQSRKWGIWNAYNRTPIVMQASDPTSSWTYAGSGVWRQSNGAAANTIIPFTGLPEEVISIEFFQTVLNGANGIAQIGVGLNSTTSPSGFSSGGPAGVNSLYSAKFTLAPTPGINNSNMIELGAPGAGSASTFKGSGSMLMTVAYRG